MRRFQKRNRTGLAKERLIMAATSVFVLAALTLTGVYVRDINKKSNDGYVVDFGEMEENVAEKADEIWRNEQTRVRRSATPAVPPMAGNTVRQAVTADDLDYDPYFQEANSHQVENLEQTGVSEILGEIASSDLEVGEAVMAAENTGGTAAQEAGQAAEAQEAAGKAGEEQNAADGQGADGVANAEGVQGASDVADADEARSASGGADSGKAKNASESADSGKAKGASGAADSGKSKSSSGTADAGKAKSASETADSGKANTAPSALETANADIPAISTAMQSALTFSDGDSLNWPVVGNVLINYSMDKTVYFPTLQQYKYNPAIIIQATEGEIITAAAAGKITSVFNDPQIGGGITMELGNGYELTYGQLANILVSEGSYVAAGDVVAEVAAPTKYYSVEGTNVYFKLTRDGKAVNPMSKLGQD